MERASGILAKIEEKSRGKPIWYPQGRMWLTEQERETLDQTKV